MTALEYLRWPTIIFLVGFFFRLAGGLLKIRHWPWGDEILTMGFIICLAAIIFAIIKLVFIKKPVE